MQPPPTWQQTKLWERLEQLEKSTSPTLRATIALLEPAETDLKSAGTTPLTFTLHDEAHGHRVAERMWELLPDDVRTRMGSLELALLLLAAYLHDIGMSPSHTIVDAYACYLATGDADRLDDEQRRRFLYFIDANYEDTEPPVADEERRAEILAYWCRDRHNDWSAAWIKETVKPDWPQLYPGWIEDLVRLCRSHHEGMAELRADAFDAKLKGNPAQVVNLRYLAALLRVADVLELDPERTPDVLLRHRRIGPASEPYWQKDHHIVLTLEREGYAVRLAAEPPTAALHKAVLETRDGIDAEHDTCAALEDEGAFARGRVGKAGGFHRWPWPRKLITDIREGGDFTFINGAFRPHPKRVLELLAGAALYDNPLVAVRELLQNAIDAIHEQTAYERLADPDRRNDEEYLQALRRRRKIWLRCETDAQGRAWLVCRDNGCGMTREIIEHDLLVSGSPRRPKLRELERRCKEAKFELTRIGRFGIGCLSYFMFADRVEIQTRRSQKAGNPDHTGWHFCTEGLDDFGELRCDENAQPGTEIRLRLKSKMLGNGIEDFTNDVSSYVREKLVWVPCCVEFSDAGQRVLWQMAEPGWVQSFRAKAIHAKGSISFGIAFNRYNSAYPTKSDVETFRQQDRHYRHMSRIAQVSLQWSDAIEGSFSSGQGRYRIHIPFFALQGGCCFLFINMDGDRLTNLPYGSMAARLDCAQVTSVNGINTVEPPRGDLNFRREWGEDRYIAVEVSLTAGDMVNLDRSRIIISSETQRALEVELGSAIRSGFDALLRDMKESRFARINESYAAWLAGPNNTRLVVNECDHLLMNDQGLVKLRPSSGPVAELDSQSKLARSKGHRLFLDDTPVDTAVPIIWEEPHRAGFRLVPEHWHRFIVPVIADKTEVSDIAMVWRKAIQNGQKVNKAPNAINMAAFPPCWNWLAGVKFGHDFDCQEEMIWNKDSRIANLVTNEAWHRVRVTHKDQTLIQENLLASPELTAAWLAYLVEEGERLSSQGYWHWLEEQCPGLLNRASAGIDGRSNDAIYVLEHGRGWMLSGDGPRWSNASALFSFPDGRSLPVPSDQSWYVQAK